MTAEKEAVAEVAAAAKRLEARLAIWVLEGSRPRPPGATAPRWWKRGLATARIFGDRVLEYVEDDDPWPLSLFDGPELDAALEEHAAPVEAGYVPIGHIAGGSWVVLARDEPPFAVSKLDHEDAGDDWEEELWEIAPSLAAFCDDLLPMTTTSLRDPSRPDVVASAEMVGERRVRFFPPDAPSREEELADSASAFTAYVAFLREQFQRGLTLASCPAGFAAAVSHVEAEAAGRATRARGR